jgi:prepilin-type N-terminal cleavage/methylation domain-containing protein
MSERNIRGFTIVEVLVAVVMLSVGVMAMVGSSAMVTRMVGRGRQDTFAGQVATARIERLRQIAASTPAAPCTAAEWKTDSVPGSKVAERWEILDNAGNARQVRLIVRYPVARRTAVDTILTTILCK